MQTFKPKRMGGEGFRPNPLDRAPGPTACAPGRIVMVATEGSGWVQLQDGIRENITATSVVIWEPGEWVEYGRNIGKGLKTESYLFEKSGKPSSPRPSVSSHR